MTEQLNMVPDIGIIIDVKELTKTDKLFKIKLEKPMDYKTGQFVEISIFGYGEVPISVSSSQKVIGQEHLEIVVRNVGKVTREIHKLKVNDRIGIRGPYGTAWPIEEAKGKDLIIIAGGIGLCPLRGAVLEAIRQKNEYKSVKLLYGAREPSLLNFKEELQEWKDQINTCYTVDEVPKGQEWDENIGVITTTFDDNIDVEDPQIMVCGPPIMIHFACKELEKRGIAPENIYISLERMMKCGVGNCGHCTVGPICICKDGPVFSLDKVKEIPKAVYLF
ncbi:MAG: FAD/NAD(P)-binding protein [Candidatus Hermodarchaeota archaeon]